MLYWYVHSQHWCPCAKIKWQKRVLIFQYLTSEKPIYRCMCCTKLIIEGMRYCLTYMAPFIMWAIVDAGLLKNDTIQQTTSTYIDDVYVNNNVVSTVRVRQHLIKFGLLSKELEWLQNDVQVLGGVQHTEKGIKEQGSKYAYCLHPT